MGSARATVQRMITLLVIAALGVSQKTYEGPLGLKWGQSVAEVKAALEGRYTLVEERATGLAYTGAFAGEPTEALVFAFDGTGLGGLVVMYPSTDVRPAARRWVDLVEQMRSSYGEPTKITKEPGSAVRKELATRYMLLDVQIAGGSWEPSATWTFANGVDVTIRVNVGAPNEHGNRPLQPVWIFGRRAVLDGIRAQHAKARDF
jgi:hypothetical protein